MEADDKRKVEEKGCDLNKKRFSSHCHRAELSENGEDVRPSTVWSVKEKGKFPLQCQSPTLETLQFPHEDGVSCEERDVDELGDLLRRFGESLPIPIVFISPESSELPSWALH